MITQEQLKKTLHYDPETGIFHWLISPSFTVSAGSKASYNRGKGYLGICINKHYYYAHRLAFLYVYGRFPVQIDHINGIRSDNRISNLREATSSQNNANRRTRNRTGFKGVVECKGGKWRAQIEKNKKVYHLGRYSTPIEAAKAYNLKAIELFQEFAKLNDLGAITNEAKTQEETTTNVQG